MSLSRRNTLLAAPGLLCAALLAACAGGTSPRAAQPAASPSATRPAFDLQAHRGGRGLSPENTLAAFGRALEIGVSTLELDIALTADGVPVISHDSALNPDHTRDAQGRWLAGPGAALHTLTLAELQVYDVGRTNPATKYGQQFPRQAPRDGQHIPTLEQLFNLVRTAGADEVRFNIETKTDPTKPEASAAPEAMVSAILAKVNAADMAPRVTIQSFDWRTLQMVAREAPGLSRAFLTSPRTLRDPRWTAGLRLEDFGSTPKLVKAAAGAGDGPVTWSPAYGDLSAAQVREAHALGLKVLPWTVNRREDMARLMDMGVDGLITDEPDVLRELMRERRLPLPKGLRG